MFDLGNTTKIFEIGKSYELGLVSFDSLTIKEKYDLNKYFAIKNEIIDGEITNVNNSLYAMNEKLDKVQNDIYKLKNK